MIEHPGFLKPFENHQKFESFYFFYKILTHEFKSSIKIVLAMSEMLDQGISRDQHLSARS